ncbi:MAG: S9 family peptidase [Candidatus Acidiferrales bacterium]
MNKIQKNRSALWLMAGAAGLFFAASGAAQAQGRKIELDDAQKIVRPSDAQISPDGREIVCVVGRTKFDEDKVESQLVLVETATGAQHALTYDRKGVGTPRWSPNGDRIAFLAAAGTGKEEAEQIFVLSMSGGEAMKITDEARGVEQYVWRPDGEAIAYVTSDEAPNKKEIEKHNDAFEVGNNDYLATEAATPSHIWLVNATGGKAKRLTSGAWSIPKAAPPSSPAQNIAWSPDGKSIVFTRQEGPNQGDSDLSTIEILNVETGETRKLTSRDKFENYAEYSPDGKQIAFWYSRDGDINNENEIIVAPTSGGDGTDITREVDRDIVRAIWMADGKSLLVGGNDGTRVAMWIQPLEGKARKIDLGDVNPSWGFWVDVSVSKNGAIAFTGSEPGRPTELYYLASPLAGVKRLTDFNHEIAALALGKMESFEWQGPDGFKEDGVLVYPPDFSKEKKYPLVLLIHGGPQAASAASFGFPGQYLASHGYVVFEPNYRGSDNLGNAYQRAITNDAGDGPGRDVMAGLAAVEKMGFVDESKIAVSGWSYGGYMTSWMIGHYHIWKAAISGAAVNDLVEEYDLSDNNVVDGYAWNGSPWTGDRLKIYQQQSPISYFSAINTPTLILCDTGDARVPISQSYAMFHALKDNGIPVQFIAYPVPGHFPGDPVRSRDVLRRWTEWLDKYLK